MRAELEVLQRTAGGWLLRFKAADPWNFELAVTAIKQLAPRERRWLKEEFAGRGGWWLSSWAFDRVGPLFSNYQQARLLAGRNETTARPIEPTEKEREAFEVLGLLPTAEGIVIQAAYRALAKAYHPDHGGDLRKMKTINAAADVAMTYAQRRDAVA